jgi:hypothetical protein
MKYARRATMICLLAFGMLILLTTAWAQKAPIAEQIAKTYGLDSWGQIEAVRYTFNLDVPALKLKASRTWIWEPKADRVTFEGKDKAGNPGKVTYVRSQLNSQPDNVKKEVDPGFINDQYWLVFPFHAVWDAAATVEDKGMQKLPVGKGSARQVVVKYPSDVGYTPGDTWELFVGADNRVQQMVFHHGGAAKPNLVVATWAGYKKAGPLLISTEHHGTADGKPMTLTFTDVAVKLTGSDTWIKAQ